MNPKEDTIGYFLNSFKSVCAVLEKKTEARLLQARKECKEEYLESEKSVRKFNELTSRIREVCAEINNNSEVLNLAKKQSVRQNAIEMPYEMHSNFVKCVKGLYKMRAIGRDMEERLKNKKNEQLVTQLIKLGGKITLELKDIESTLIEAKENLKGVTREV